MNKSICVYCSSSNYLDKKFYDLAKDFGKAIAENGYNLVYGGTTVGMMGELANSVLTNGQQVTGVIPERIKNAGLQHPELADCILTDDMRDRKATMEKLSDIFIAIPGGFGTFDEIFEILVRKQLGYHQKPIIFLNLDGYYNPLIKMFDNIYEYKFAKEDMKNLYFIANSIEEVFEYIKNYKESNFVFKW